MDSTVKWKKRPTFQRSHKAPILLSVFVIIALFVSSKTLISPALRNSRFFIKAGCGGSVGASGERFLWYAPHSGFSNQLSEFKNAILMAAILKRTLIVPPILDHHAVALGSCPKFRVLDPNELRFKVWNHSVELIRDRRYISMADVIDLSSLVSGSTVRFIDFRAFVSMWCGVNLNLVCSAKSDMYSSFLEKMNKCGLFLSGYDGNMDNCLYASQEDCRTTIWTFQADDDGILDSFQADEELKKKRKVSFLRKRYDVYKALGPGSAAEPATVLAFGSLFTAPYKGSQSHIDIQAAPRDRRIQSLIQKMEFLHFVPEILNAGRKFALNTIKAPFLCAQLRLLDGQFKNHWKGTFHALQQNLDSLKQKGSLPIHVFVMTDLPRHNWTGTFLGNLQKDSNVFKLFVLGEEDELVSETAKKVLNAGYGMKLQSDPSYFDRTDQHCSALSFPEMLLYIEETICSCAPLGFVGTTGSTIAVTVELMRTHGVCS
ncbi:O-fucosyltransferase 30 [Andrographis paniculata]|uniref:O-fucosyltransferase 30 n=1 Tax=Andrographis paniculata TaxID=175694 RepID=UPI0021E80A73|nr:O-fucosyltransferase 30 [Andrographis paniculata]